MARTTVVQVDAHCDGCHANAKVDPSALGRWHKKHNRPVRSKNSVVDKQKAGRWVAGKYQKPEPAAEMEAAV